MIIPTVVQRQRIHTHKCCDVMHYLIHVAYMYVYQYNTNDLYINIIVLIQLNLFKINKHPKYKNTPLFNKDTSGVR